MTRFEATLERLRALPDDQKDVVAARIDLMLDDDGEDLLTPEEWADIEARLDTEDATIPHEDVMREARERFGF